MALEDNLATLASNMNHVRALAAPEKLAALRLPELEDLTKLRERIHTNMTPSSGVSRMDSPEAEAEDELVHKTPMKVKPEPVDSVAPTLPLAPSAASAPAASGYYNYMSPVSMRSPVSSPINLTLKSADSSSESDSGPATPEMSTMASGGLIIGPATSGIDFMAQNSEAILSPRVVTA